MTLAAAVKMLLPLFSKGGDAKNCELCINEVLRRRREGARKGRAPATFLASAFKEEIMKKQALYYKTLAAEPTGAKPGIRDLAATSSKFLFFSHFFFFLAESAEN